MYNNVFVFIVYSNRSPGLNLKFEAIMIDLIFNYYFEVIKQCLR